MAYLQISPVLATPAVQIISGIVYITAETRSTSGALTSAGTSTLVEIVGPAGTIVQAYTAMTADGTGLFSYKYATAAATSSPGHYTVNVKCTDSGDVSVGTLQDAFILTTRD